MSRKRLLYVVESDGALFLESGERTKAAARATMADLKREYPGEDYKPWRIVVFVERAR